VAPKPQPDASSVGGRHLRLLLLPNALSTEARNRFDSITVFDTCPRVPRSGIHSGYTLGHQWVL
jgi:hypothetical protein